MREDHRAGVVMQCALDDFARIDTGLCEGAAEQFLDLDDAVLRIEKQRDEHLVRQRLHFQTQEVANCRGRTERVAAGEFFAQCAARHLDDRLQLRKLGAADTGQAAQFLLAGGTQCRQRTEARQQFAGKIDRAFATDADAQENGQQFRIGQHGRPPGQQLLARPVVDRPIGDGHAHSAGCIDTGYNARARLPAVKPKG